MDSLIKKIQDLEREARRLKAKELREVSTPPTQPSSIWSLRRDRLDRRSPPRPTAARSLTLLEKKFQSSPAPPPYTVRKVHSRTAKPTTFAIDGCSQNLWWLTLNVHRFTMDTFYLSTLQRQLFSLRWLYVNFCPYDLNYLITGTGWIKSPKALLSLLLLSEGQTLTVWRFPYYF